MTRRRQPVAMAPGPVVDLEPLGPAVGKNRPTGTTREKVKKRDGYRCRYCGSADNLTVDHVIPKSKGGTNRMDNLVTACGDCNSAKADSEGAMPSPPPFTGRKRRRAA